MLAGSSSSIILLDTGYVKGVYYGLDALLPLLLLGPFQDLIEFALAWGQRQYQAHPV
ncbi:MAG: hypothetical protein Q3M30_13620 [Candidatus Electrothrix sp. Rat3]|nr:hypothetical protein [Candidatus Electrothrix rattekaaiensis]